MTTWIWLGNLEPTIRPVLLFVRRYASVQAMESPSKLDDEQWLAYWILYSFITLVEMVLESLIYW
jgi:receptor expression-enhancing protein 5/6